MAVKNVNGPIGESSNDVSAWQRSDIPSWKYCCRPSEEGRQASASSRADTGRLLNCPEGKCLFPPTVETCHWMQHRLGEIRLLRLFMPAGLRGVLLRQLPGQLLYQLPGQLRHQLLQHMPGQLLRLVA